MLFAGLTVAYQMHPIVAEFGKAESQRIWRLNEEVPGTAEHFLRDVKPVGTPLEDLPARPWNAVAKTTAFALGIPLLVLCAGLLVAWIGAGFRDNRAD